MDSYSLPENIEKRLSDIEKRQNEITKSIFKQEERDKMWASTVKEIIIKERRVANEKLDALLNMYGVLELRFKDHINGLPYFVPTKFDE